MDSFWNSSVIRQKGESLNRCFEKTKYAKFSEKPVLRFALLPYCRRTVERSLSKIGTMNNINMVSRKFRENMSKGNVNSAIKVLSNNMYGFMLTLNKETI